MEYFHCNHGAVAAMRNENLQPSIEELPLPSGFPAGYFRDLKVSALAPVFQAVQRRPTIPWNQKRQFQKKDTFGSILLIPSTKLPYDTKEL